MKNWFHALQKWSLTTECTIMVISRTYFFGGGILPFNRRYSQHILGNNNMAVTENIRTYVDDNISITQKNYWKHIDWRLTSSSKIFCLKMLIFKQNTQELFGQYTSNIHIYIWYIHKWLECLPMAQATGVQSQVESYQRLKKWYLMPPCLSLSIIRYRLKVSGAIYGKE